MKSLGIVLLVAVAHYAAAGTKTDDAADANRPVYRVVYRPQNYRRYGSYGYDGSYKRYDDSYTGYEDSNRRYEDTGSYGGHPSTHAASAERLHLSGGIFRPYGYDDEAYAYDTGSNKPYAYDMKHYGDTDGRYAKYPNYRRQY